MQQTPRGITYLFIGTFLLLILIVALGRSAKATSTSFTFTASGDHSANRSTTAGLNLLATAGASFNLALGDFSYSQLVPESAWCDYVKSHVGEMFPFELLAGNHEDDGPDGLIENFAACLPDRLGTIVGEYGKEYYFDYPTDAPIARFILISPGLTFSDGQKYTYTTESARYNWLANRIDDARTAGLPWVIVGMHKNCLTMATKTCEIGADLMNLLISKNVDLVLQAHDHSYQRSKQLALSATCPVVPVGLFEPFCVADDGSDDVYTAGNGTVFVIDATFGADLYDINPLDPEAAYFARWMGNNADPRHGFMKYMVSETAISAQYIGSTAGSFTDSFILVQGSTTYTPPPTRTHTLVPVDTSTPTRTPTSPAGTNRLTFTVEADTRVKQASPGSNYGALSYLSVDGASDPAEESYLRFTVSGVNNSIQSAKLRIYMTANTTNNGPAIYLADSAWTESAMTWNTKPALLSGAGENKGALASNAWVEYDVTPWVGTNGIYTFALIADSTDGAEFSSREGAFPAQLVVTYATSASTVTPTRTLTDTPEPIDTSTSTRTSTPTDVVSASDTPDASPTQTFTDTPRPTFTATRTETSTSTASVTPSRTFTPTRTATTTSTRTPTPVSASDVIFANGFESGSLGSWSAAVTDGTDLSVSTAAALVGNEGLRAVVNNTAVIYVRDDTPAAEARYRARFYFDPNSITMASGNAHYIFYGYHGTSTPVMRVEFRRSSGSYQLRAAIRNDKSTWLSSDWFIISDAAHFVEVDWRSSTASGANNGGLTFWIDGSQRASLSGVDNDSRRLDRIALGAIEGIDSGTLGTYYFDAFESRRQTYIGP